MTKRRVCIIGAGAAGLACAWSLSRFPDRYDIHVFEKAQHAGGVATSEAIDPSTCFNDGVQGCTPSYRNTLLFHRVFGFEPRPTELRVSFGKDEYAWNNSPDAPPTDIVKKCKKDIRRFGSLLKWIHRMETVFTFVPIRLALKLSGVSRMFRDYMLYPLIALFFGTGNQTPNVSSAVIARVFLDPEMRLFDYDAERFVSQTPEMYAFEPLKDIYGTAVTQISATGCATFHFGCPVSKMERGQDSVRIAVENGSEYEFEDCVFACDAESVLKILGHEARFMERRVLGNVKYYNDITVTHQDELYMEKNYTLDRARGDQYFVRTYPSDPELIDMSFDLSNYQPSLEAYEKPVFQTIFLNDNLKDRWGIGEIREESILCSVFAPLIVPGTEGLAVAERLGAEYPFHDDEMARKQFETLMSISHGRKARRARE